jgi:hypothetical protein
MVSDMDRVSSIGQETTDPESLVSETKQSYPGERQNAGLLWTEPQQSWSNQVAVLMI